MSLATQYVPYKVKDLSLAEWLKNITSGTYQEYYDNMYAAL